MQVELREDGDVGEHDEDDDQVEVEREVQNVRQLHREHLGLSDPNEINDFSICRAIY